MEEAIPEQGEHPAWHPKLTPYRLTVISTSLILGTWKAISTQKGDTILPVTLEWISGVAIFLLLFWGGIYDLKGVGVYYLDWLFTFDVSSLLRRVRSSVVGPEPPRALKEESARDDTKSTEDSVTPLLSAYHILVSLTVVLFGMTKAVLIYSNKCTPANWIDWTLGVAASSIFFTLGLYENNPIGLASWLFVLDRRLDATLFVAAIPSAIGALLCLTSLYYAAHKVLHIWKTERHEWHAQHPGATFEAKFVDCFGRYISSFLPCILGLYSFLVFTIMWRKLTRRLQTLWHHLANPPREAQSIPLLDIDNADIERGDQQTERPVQSAELASYSGEQGKSVMRRMVFILQEISVFIFLLTLALSWLFFGLGVWWIMTMLTFHKPWHLHELLTAPWP